MRVADIMNKVIAIDEDTSVKEAAKIMSERNIGCLIIMNGEKIKGLITERDILRNITKSAKKVSAIMSRDIITVDENESIDNAAIVMSENRVRKLPVVSNGKLVGIITATDLIQNSEHLNLDFLLD
jgi:IMP dehydrogenase